MTQIMASGELLQVCALLLIAMTTECITHRSTEFVEHEHELISGACHYIQQSEEVFLHRTTR